MSLGSRTYAGFDGPPRFALVRLDGDGVLFSLRSLEAPDVRLPVAAS